MLTKKGATIALVKSKYGGNEQDTEAVFEKLSRDLWCILSANAESEAEGKMEGCYPGQGMWAYLRLHRWFTRTTAQGRSVRRAGIMNPTRCKHEHKISAAIERCDERYRILQEDDAEL